MQEVCWKDSQGKGWFPVPWHLSSPDSVISYLLDTEEFQLRSYSTQPDGLWNGSAEGVCGKLLPMAISGHLFWSCKWDSRWSWRPVSCFLTSMRWCLGLVADLKTLKKFCSSWITYFGQLGLPGRPMREKRHHWTLYQPGGLMERQLASYRFHVVPKKGFLLMRSCFPEHPEWNPSAKL